MAKPVNFKGANLTLAAPPHVEGTILPIPVFTNKTTIVSCWEFTHEELAQILIDDGKVFLTVFGMVHPPVFIGGHNETRAMNADYGIWKK